MKNKNVKMKQFKLLQMKLNLAKRKNGLIRNTIAVEFYDIEKWNRGEE